MRSRWSMVAAFALLGTVTQVLWVTFAPVTDAAADHYGVSVGAIGWLANVFPLLYVLLAIPAGVVLDRWFRAGLGAGAVWAFAGQVVVAIGQPLVLNAITGVAARYLAEPDRPKGIAIGSASTFAGLIVGFGLGTVLDVRPLLQVQAALAVAAAVVVFVALRIAWADSYSRWLCGLVFVPFGVFVALTTFAQPLLEPAGVSASTAGLILVANVVAGVIGCAVVPIWATRREVPVMGVALLVTAGACVTLAVVPGVVTGYAALTLLGFALLPALPIVLGLTERRAGAAEGTAADLIWLAGNLGGLVVAAVIGLLVDQPAMAFALLGVLSVLTLGVLRMSSPASSPTR